MTQELLIQQQQNSDFIKKSLQQTMLIIHIEIPTGGEGDPDPEYPEEPPSDWFDSILSWVMDNLSGVFESLAVPFNAIAEGLDSIFGVIQSIGYSLNPFHETFFLKVALVPTEGFEQNIWTEAKAALELKNAINISNIRIHEYNWRSIYRKYKTRIHSNIQ